MKKILLKSIATLLGLTMAASSFAAPVQGFSKLSIQEALQAHNAAIHQSVTARAATVGTDTNIVIINFTDDTIIANVPTAQIQLTRLTAGRYQKENYTGQTRVQLTNANGAVFYDQFVDYQDLLSVYVSGDQYVVYNTH